MIIKLCSFEFRDCWMNERGSSKSFLWACHYFLNFLYLLMGVLDAALLPSSWGPWTCSINSNMLSSLFRRWSFLLGLGIYGFPPKWFTFTLCLYLQKRIIQFLIPQKRRWDAVLPFSPTSWFRGIRRVYSVAQSGSLMLLMLLHLSC